MRQARAKAEASRACEEEKVTTTTCGGRVRSSVKEPVTAAAPV